MTRLFLTAAAAALLASTSMGYESIYERTDPGKIRLKDVPTRKALQTESDRSYFESDRSLFMDLFNYIRENDLKMTVPVEADVEIGRMRFLMGEADAKRSMQSTDDVAVVRKPGATVVSYGLRGAYTKKGYEKGMRALEKWLSSQSDYDATGPAYIVYWNSPWVPAPLKRSEIHLPVKKTGSD